MKSLRLGFHTLSSHNDQYNGVNVMVIMCVY